MKLPNERWHWCGKPHVAQCRFGGLGEIAWIRNDWGSAYGDGDPTVEYIRDRSRALRSAFPEVCSIGH